MIIAGNSDGIFKRLMHAIGRDDLGEDPKLARNDGRVQHNDMIDEAITQWTSRHELEQVLDVLNQADVPSGRIYTAADIHEDPHYRARGMIEAAKLPDGEAFDLPGIVPKLSATPGATKWIGPKLGEHTEEVLAGIGMGPERIAELREKNVI